MVIILKSIANGTKIKVERLNSSKWVDENGVELSNQQHIKILNDAQIGAEIGGLLYESRYQIIEVNT
ncbi:hypothetical protein [Acinetobacter sp. ESBL14]|uniref:hypothetical protein n=1 Tax=Acinetobacter sp. ESBL14 TaxID=3077329 RepID=UPI002FC5DC34